MEDRASQGMDLVAAVFAFVAFAGTDTVVPWVDDTTVGAGGHGAVCLFEHIVQASSIVWEALVELFDGECFAHATSVLQGLHVVKG